MLLMLNCWSAPVNGSVVGSEKNSNNNSDIAAKVNNEYDDGANFIVVKVGFSKSTTFSQCIPLQVCRLMLLLLAGVVPAAAYWRVREVLRRRV
jgi:hypothetical protein